MKRWLFTTAAAAAMAAGSSRAADAPANVTVTVPVGATLTINGQRTQQMTAVRQFVSPPLDAGQKYVYTFQATYTWNGKTVTRLLPVEVWSGATVTVDMHTAPEAELPKSEPVPVEPDPRPGRFDVIPKPSEPRTTDPSRTPQPQPQDDPPPTVIAPEKKQQVERPEIVVPYVPTPDKVVAEMLKLANVKEGDVVYDLGSGDGRIVIAAVKEFGAKRGLGIDFNPERIKDARDNARKAGAEVEQRVEFKQGDVLTLTEKDFEGVDVVTLYLLPEVNLKLMPVLQKGLKPGARVVSHDFDMGDEWKPDQTVEVMDEEGREHTVYLWTIKKDD
jgi:uncharacterized protein (TIGR03000 family)